MFQKPKKLTLTVCSSHVTYSFQSESTLHSCLNVKELFARSKIFDEIILLSNSRSIINIISVEWRMSPSKLIIMLQLCLFFFCSTITLNISKSFSFTLQGSFSINGSNLHHYHCCCFARSNM